ncbi:cytochrome c oxidase subunit 5b-2, mitochondrial-like isoform X1 [Abrus precatorius]|uniref:Cytochrome c oxidase subunit 5b-2, mitochondrial-like isoform X1 n=1 Tax=Abrus precatorius TaxID=3816 RepID=A0A8B8KPM6_ABRPR|nr:cytochrome c oxidase subunit 5b-2, mitochondrial-like isoform X1 [Abrus precatorius]
MWRRLLSSHLKTLTVAASSSSTSRSASAAARFAVLPRFSRYLSTQSGTLSLCIFRFLLSDSLMLLLLLLTEDSTSIKKKVEDVMPIATGHEREELQAELEGRDILEINHPVGPFGTKEAPAIVKSYYDKRIVGCPGGEGEDEHDVVWFWLEKGKPHECPVCAQYFVLEVVGPGGPPDGHGDDDHH